MNKLLRKPLFSNKVTLRADLYFEYFPIRHTRARLHVKGTLGRSCSLWPFLGVLAVVIHQVILPHPPELATQILIETPIPPVVLVFRALGAFLIGHDTCIGMVTAVVCRERRLAPVNLHFSFPRSPSVSVPVGSVGTQRLASQVRDPLLLQILKHSNRRIIHQPSAHSYMKRQLKKISCDDSQFTTAYIMLWGFQMKV